MLSDSGREPTACGGPRNVTEPCGTIQLSWLWLSGQIAMLKEGKNAIGQMLVNSPKPVLRRTQERLTQPCLSLNEVHEAQDSYMQLALHFDERIMNQAGQMYWSVAKPLFRTALQLPRPEIASQVFIGSLLLHQRCYERSDEHEGAWTEKFNPSLPGTSTPLGQSATASLLHVYGNNGQDGCQ